MLVPGRIETVLTIVNQEFCKPRGLSDSGGQSRVVQAGTRKKRTGSSAKAESLGSNSHNLRDLLRWLPIETRAFAQIIWRRQLAAD
jgi:hypothetical protein